MTKIGPQSHLPFEHNGMPKIKPSLLNNFFQRNDLRHLAYLILKSYCLKNLGVGDCSRGVSL